LWNCLWNRIQNPLQSLVLQQTGSERVGVEPYGLLQPHLLLFPSCIISRGRFLFLVCISSVGFSAMRCYLHI
jgi:hypothetical protein